MRRSGLVNLALYLLLFILYFVSAWLGLKVHAVNGFATLIWVPTGLSLAFLYIFGMRFWPSIFLGALAANYVTGAPFFAAMGISIGNTLEAVVAVYILRRYVKLEPQLNQVSGVLGLIFYGAFLSTAISATIGVTSLLLAGTINGSEYGNTWLSWWSGDATSDLVIAALFLVWSTQINKKTRVAYIIEVSSLLALITAISLLIFSPAGQSLGGGRPITYLIFPPIIWVALRYGPRASATAVFLLAAVAIWQTTHNLGPFVMGNPSTDLLFSQAYVAVAAILGLVVAATVSEQKMYERKQNEFISVASHELKTPLTSIKTLVQTVEAVFEKKADKQSSELLKRADRQIDRLNRLVAKLLDLSRIQEGRIVLQKEKFILAELVSEIVEEIDATTPHKFLINGKQKVTVKADRDRIGRVLTNLLSNATRYSPGSKKIIVKISKKPDVVVVSVQDFGKGIYKTDQNKIFDRFYQSEVKNANPEHNLGLGLYLSKEIIESHGGKIWVKSNPPKKGSTFYFTLPTKG